MKKIILYLKKIALYKWKMIIICLALVAFIINCDVAWASVHKSLFPDEIFEYESVKSISLVPDFSNVFTNVTAEDLLFCIETIENEEANRQIPEDDWKLILVNKQHPIPEEYTFEVGSVDTAKGKMRCDKRVIPELTKMIADADKDGVSLLICSPYRSSVRQTFLFEKKVKTYMKQGMPYMDAYYMAAQAVTIPGSSEHEMGLAIDFNSKSYYALNEGFGESDAGKWLAEHCDEYGFIIRYPKGKEDITGIEYEPWHLRYVGKNAAKEIKKQDLCLEEFVELIKN